MIWDVRGSGSWWSVSNSNQSLHQLIAEDGSVFRAESTGFSHAVISHAVSRTLLPDGPHLTRKSFLAKKGKPGVAESLLNTENGILGHATCKNSESI
jgi:hypothetical protein